MEAPLEFNHKSYLTCVYQEVKTSKEAGDSPTVGARRSSSGRINTSADERHERMTVLQSIDTHPTADTDGCEQIGDAGCGRQARGTT